jgi:arylsulfatase A-like enzyme
LTSRPNFLLIVADDLGWSDLGAFGGEIDTPCLDAIARRGRRLTSFHASPVCSTTRAMLMTGCDHHEVGLGNMAELLTPDQVGKPGYEGRLNDRVPTVAQRLRMSGYRTMMSGKWHLSLGGYPLPTDKGFDRSFALLQGEHNHYGVDQTAQEAGALGISEYVCDGERVEYPKGSYSSDVFAQRLIEFLDEPAAQGTPFFAYLALTAPHSPLQAPPELIAKYKGRYDEGPHALRDARLARMRALGMAAGHVTPAHVREAKPWSALDPSERALEVRKMEIYAAMVEAMDVAIGRVLDALERHRKLADTVVIFMSDNGPAGGLREETPPWKDWIEKHADNRLENVGAASSYVSTGPRWAKAQAAPYFLFKRHTTEGGVRTCAVAAGPGIGNAGDCEAFVHAMDIAPTLLEWAGAGTDSGSGDLPIRGRSAADVLSGQASRGPHPQAPLGWELCHARAIWIDGWKAVFLPPGARSADPQVKVGEWMLFDMASDPGERDDLAQAQPGKLAELVAAWHAYAAETGVVVRPDAPVA